MENQAHFRPAYAALAESGGLEERAAALAGLLSPCRACPRSCGALRLEGGRGACFGGRAAQVASWCDHHGEEPPISGRAGSGTIFFRHCNLRCVYCQNHEISQSFDRSPQGEMTAEALAGVMLGLQRQGCHNINWVSPSHFAPQAVEALALAARQGLGIPIVYNTNAYDAPEVLDLLDGIVDIYLPDLKYADAETGRRLSRVRDYPRHARAAIERMWRQVGPLQCGPDGAARQGMIVRHLVLPNDLADSEASLRWLAETCGTGMTLSLMGQYWPAHHAQRDPLLARTITAREYNRVIEFAQRLGFQDILVQDHVAAAEFYRPDFSRDHPFEQR